MRIKHLMTFALAGVATATLGNASAVTLRMATKVSPESPEGQVNQKFAELVEERTNGEVELDIYWSEQLGDAQSSLEQVSSGIIDIYSEDITYLEKWNPDISWVGAPFVFDDREHWTCFLSGDYFGDMLQKATEESGITTIGKVGPVVRGPYRVILSTDPIENIDDIENLKLRIWDNQLMVDVWSALGAEVRVLGWTDVYQSIQTGIVESVTSPASLIEPMKFTEVAPHVMRTDEFNQAVTYMINEDSWGKLDDGEQAGVLEAYEEAGEYSQTLVQNLTDEALERLTGKGVTYGELDTGPFVERTQAIYEERASRGEIPDGFLEAVDAARAACG